jgi:hypothetical protein
MKFFTHRNLRGPIAFEAARRAYWQHIKDIRADLPSPLFDLHYHYTLHDAEITSFTEVRSSPDLFLILDGCRNGTLADTDRVVFVLHFINSKHSKRSLQSFISEEILYIEIMRGDSRRWKFSALTTKSSRKDTFSLEFDDYRVGPK